MRRALLIAVLCLTGLLAAAPAASADSGSFSDPSGDLCCGTPVGSTGPLDIVRATVGHKRGRVVHTVTTAGNVGNPARGSNFPVMFMEHPTRGNGTAECALFAGRFDGRLGIFTCAYGHFVASARITRTSARTIRVEFDPRSLGNPPNYEWAFRTRSATNYNSSAWVDRIPSGNNEFFTHTLR